MSVYQCVMACSLLIINVTCAAQICIKALGCILGIFIVTTIDVIVFLPVLLETRRKLSLTQPKSDKRSWKVSSVVSRGNFATHSHSSGSVTVIVLSTGESSGLLLSLFDNPSLSFTDCFSVSVSLLLTSSSIISCPEVVIVSMVRSVQNNIIVIMKLLSANEWAHYNKVQCTLCSECWPGDGLPHTKFVSWQGQDTRQAQADTGLVLVLHTRVDPPPPPATSLCLYCARDLRWRAWPCSGGKINLI